MGNGGYVNFIDLNQACPKDSFSLPRICQLVNSTARHELLTFMDAFSGYNQICMSKKDQDKMTFITSQRLYCYKMMPFGLNNAKATYQRLVNQIFNKKINRNVEVYVNDMLVKARETQNIWTTKERPLTQSKKYKMKLNLAKFSFGVSSGKFLGFMVSQ